MTSHGISAAIIHGSDGTTAVGSFQRGVEADDSAGQVRGPEQPLRRCAGRGYKWKWSLRAQRVDAHAAPSSWRSAAGNSTFAGIRLMSPQNLQDESFLGSFKLKVVV